MLTATRTPVRLRTPATDPKEVKINKSDLIETLTAGTSTKVSLDRYQAEEVVDTMLHFIAVSLAAGETVAIRNFGKFEPRTRRPVTRTNPRTGKVIEVPTKVSVGFVPAQKLKDRLNRS